MPGVIGRAYQTKEAQSSRLGFVVLAMDESATNGVSHYSYEIPFKYDILIKIPLFYFFCLIRYALNSDH